MLFRYETSEEVQVDVHMAASEPSSNVAKDMSWIVELHEMLEVNAAAHVAGGAGSVGSDELVYIWKEGEAAVANTDETSVLVELEESGLVDSPTTKF
jgi:hypothetical protein